VLTQNGVRDGVAAHLDVHHVLLRLLGALADAVGHLLGLAVAHAHVAMAVADDHERSEREAAAAFDDLGAAVDVHNLLDQVALLLLLNGTTASATAGRVRVRDRRHRDRRDHDRHGRRPDRVRGRQRRDRRDGWASRRRRSLGPAGRGLRG
jgi:hypothetical protein